jgi:hypothetical protein
MLGEESIEGQAQVYLRFLPKPRVTIEIEAASESMEPSVDAVGDNIQLKGSGVRVPGFATQMALSFPGIEQRRITFLPNPNMVTIGDPDAEQIEQAIFHVLNFDEVFGDGCLNKKYAEGRLEALGVIPLKSVGWDVFIHLLPDVRESIKGLKGSGGYAITHVGRCRRTDGMLFSGNDAADILQALHYLLSFGRGFWVAPILPVGLDESGEPIWRQWGVPQTDSWVSAPSWFSPLHSGMLREVFPGFMGRWRSPLWQEAIRHAIYWYLASNSGVGIDTGLVLTQIALESLSWVLLVRDLRRLSRNGFEKLPAAEAIRTLLNELGIPVDIPAPLKDLQREGKARTWQDGPHAVTAVRNSIVHADRGSSVGFGNALFEAWTLSQWQLELALLALFGHKGKYHNRLVRGLVSDAEDVPWAT